MHYNVSLLDKIKTKRRIEPYVRRDNVMLKALQNKCDVPGVTSE